MKKHITAVIFITVLSAAFYTSCQENNEGASPRTMMQITKFDDTHGDCAHGGVKFEVLVDGLVDDTQTQYICNGAQGQDGQDAQDGASVTIQTTKFDDEQGDCVYGGVKVEVLVDGLVDDTQTQYLCNGAHGMMFCNGIAVDTRNDSANCGDCDIACADLNVCKKGKCQTPSVGDIITFGHYEQDNDFENGKEPIEWRVLKKNAEEGQILILTDKVLDIKQYHEELLDITWERSTVRSWLNGYDASHNDYGSNYINNNFINTAFTSEEQSKIVASNVPSHANPEYDTTPGNVTTDKLFLLSIVEVEEYFSDNTSLKADTSRYVVKSGGYVRGSVSDEFSDDGSCMDEHCYIHWWLRTPGDVSGKAAVVLSNGSIRKRGIGVVQSIGIGVRPALWLEY